MSDPWNHDPSDPRRSTADQAGVPWGPIPPSVQGPLAPTTPGPWATGQQTPAGPQQGWAPVDINQYAAPRTRPSTIMLVVAACAVVGLVIATMLLRGTTPASTPTPTPTASVSVSGMPFTVPTSPDSTGHWEIVGREWTAAGVSVHVHISVESGNVSYAFQAFGMGETDATSPSLGGPQPELKSGVLSAGEVADGYLLFKLPHADSTLFMTTRGGKAISALPIAS